MVGEEHYNVARQRAGASCSATSELQDIIAILGMEELDEDGQADRQPRP